MHFTKGGLSTATRHLVTYRKIVLMGVILIKGLTVLLALPFRGCSPGRMLSPGAPDVKIAVLPLPQGFGGCEGSPVLIVPPVVEPEPTHRLHVPYL